MIFSLFTVQLGSCLVRSGSRGSLYFSDLFLEAQVRVLGRQLARYPFHGCEDHEAVRVFASISVVFYQLSQRSTDDLFDSAADPEKRFGGAQSSVKRSLEDSTIHADHEDGG